MSYLLYETSAFNEGWQAFWTAKRLGECPYVGQRQAEWYAGYAAAEAEAHADAEMFGYYSR